MKNLYLNDAITVDDIDEDTLLLYNPLSRSYHVLNSAARLIYENCTRLSRNEIFDLIRKKYDISELPDDDLVKDITDTIKLLLNQNIIRYE